jgi:hypothetical protein
MNLITFKNMKIELVKEEKLHHSREFETWYWVEVNGKMISDSYTQSLDIAQEFYNKVVEFKGKIEQRTVLDSVNIEIPFTVNEPEIRHELGEL